MFLIFELSSTIYLTGSNAIKAIKKPSTYWELPALGIQTTAWKQYILLAPIKKNGSFSLKLCPIRSYPRGGLSFKNAAYSLETPNKASWSL